MLQERLDYMRYDCRTMENLSLDLSKVSVKGELGLQGELTGKIIPSVLAEFFVAEGERKASLEQHLEWVTLADSPSFGLLFRPPPIENSRVS